MTEREIQLHFDGDAYFSRLIAQIDSAQTEVLVETYIFDFDIIGRRILKSLAAARKRGVEVKLLIDGLGSFNWLNDIEKFCLECDIQLKVYHPLPFRNLKTISWKNLRRWLRFFRKINRRNHRKFCLIDNQRVFIGSFNISQVHSREFMQNEAWRDTAVEILYQTSHPDVILLREVFLKTFYRTISLKSHSQKLFQFKKSLSTKLQPQKDHGNFRVNTSLWSRIHLSRDLKKRIRQAQKRILITNAYFLPRRFLLKGLRSAAERGVYVGLILPEKTDVWFVREASRSLYYRLLSSGVHIFEYQPSVLHAKTTIIDDWATVGSFNLNHRSMLHDLEIEAIINDKNTIRQLTEKWDSDASRSKKFNFYELGQFRWPQRALSRIIYWFRYWL